LVYALDDPPGVLAGFPWFGEWGRDTFVSLPGIALAWCRLDEAAAGGWSSRLLERWSRWIEREDMLPNFLGPAGSTHWESADATLWFTHAVAALWSYGERLPALRASAEAALPAVEAAVRGIVAGRHRYLRVEGDGLVSVTGDRTTWMDANVDGAAVTPRNGRLPEINALWAQAHVLLALAGGRGAPAARRLADLALEVREAEPRPHRVFLGSLPLAPGWRRGGAPFLAAELAALSAAGLSTPVGPRTLAAGAPDYRGRYEGDQRARDRAYHRGAVWPWVSAHWAMTAQRAGGEWVGAARAAWEELRRRAPIEDQLPEMCEGDPPHAPVGAPAQAWSVAAWEEWRWREVNAGFDRAWQDVSSRRPRRNA
jgi:4-alpha-glucanotransferase